MAYVDLNPVRARIGIRPETSSHTGLRERMQPEFSLHKAVNKQTQRDDLREFNTSPKPPLSFEGGLRSGVLKGILFNFQEYLKLVDWTGHIIREDKRSNIDNALPPILHRLQISPRQWYLNNTQFEAIRVLAAGLTKYGIE